MSVHFTTEKTSGCANVWSNSSRAERVCGWDGGHPGFAVWKLLNYTRIENTHKVRKKTFFFIIWLLYIKLLGGQNRQGRRSSGRAGGKRVEGNGNLYIKDKQNRY